MTNKKVVKCWCTRKDQLWKGQLLIAPETWKYHLAMEKEILAQKKVLASLEAEAIVSQKIIGGLVKVLKIPGHDAVCNEGEFCYPRCPKRIAKEAVAKAKEALQEVKPRSVATTPKRNEQGECEK